MRRHPVLIPISKEHHHILMLAQLLKKDAPEYRGLPTTLVNKLTYASGEYERFLKSHLSRDGRSLYPFLRQFQSFDGTLMELQKLMKKLNLSFERLENFDVKKTHELGVMLENYVRLKERVLFQEIQKGLTAHDFAALADRLGIDK